MFLLIEQAPGLFCNELSILYICRAKLLQATAPTKMEHGCMGLTNRVMTLSVFCFSKEKDIWGLQVTYADEKLHPQPRNGVVTS